MDCIKSVLPSEWGNQSNPVLCMACCITSIASLGARPFLRGGRGKRERGLETLAVLPCALGMTISGGLLEVIKKAEEVGHASRAPQ